MTRKYWVGPGPLRRAARRASRERCYPCCPDTAAPGHRPPIWPPPARARSSRRSGTTHVVAEEPGAPAILAVDLHLVHEVTSPQAFTGLRGRGLTVRRPDKTVATADHSTPTTPRGLPMIDMQAAAQISQLEVNCREFGIPIHAFGSDTQGIVHVIGPELGLTQPGMTIVCGDSHTATHGAFGALAFGIGTSEVEMVLATQTLLQRKPKTYEVRVDGRLAPGRQRQGHHPRADRPDRDRRRHGPRVRVPGRGHPRADDGAADDDLQHEHRGRRAGRPDRARRHDLRVPPRPPPRAAGRRPGTRRSPAGGTLPTDDGRGVRPLLVPRRRRARADGHLGQQPGHGRADLGPPAAARGRRATTQTPAGPRARVRVHGADARRADRRPPGGRGVHRQLHQQPDQRPAPGRVASSRTAGRPTGCG